MTKNALQRAIESVGNARLFAAKLNITEQSVGKWKNKYNGIVPSARVLEIFHATGVTPHELRPDLYPNPTDGLPIEYQNTTKEN
ncbi:MAG TPA: Rha family transcriptional regulator [Hafnia paralvei]|uniref:transcriptional regulator n=1 Tax=Hafnia paralvei TaxID=546367 RepID=UPI000EE050AB|nr:YdaS family helix-turn-helix protein [Hafnia paralvei]HCU16924.1 Rha family transcriptional regulator [Hafnia paralvei]